VQGWLAAAQAGHYRAAWELIVSENPFPAVHGRVCYHPCEDGCNRRQVDGAVSIHAVERFVGDLAIAEHWPIAAERAPTGRRVLVVGAGPAGLSAAWHLARLGHAVVVHDAAPLAGGMMQIGIPKYRLPREVLDAEIRRIQSLGVEIILNHPVDDVLAEKAAGGFDAVFLAVGAQLSKRTDMSVGDAAKIYDALTFLEQANVGQGPPIIGRRVAIYGGGNTAMDAARTARRLGARETFIIYRRTRAQMPAHGFEADEAIEEGVTIRWLRTIKQIDSSRCAVEVMALDDAGYPRPTGRFETLEANTLILAIGQDVDTSFLRCIPGIEFAKDGAVIVGPNMMTGHVGIFAGGDMVPFERTVTTAVGHGKTAARHIDAWLHGRTYSVGPVRELAAFRTLHGWYRIPTRPRKQAILDLERRRSTFDEVVSGFDPQSASYEAQRCYSCGNCFECDGCYGACPKHAIIKLGAGLRYRYDFDRCTGCGICFEQCPCGAIAMVREPSGPWWHAEQDKQSWPRQ
jgi:NADPH-dependent glutamate synthase beta subunit-like oxidoreductase